MCERAWRKVPVVGRVINYHGVKKTRGVSVWSRMLIWEEKGCLFGHFSIMFLKDISQNRVFSGFFLVLYKQRITVGKQRLYRKIWGCFSPNWFFTLSYKTQHIFKIIQDIQKKLKSSFFGIDFPTRISNIIMSLTKDARIPATGTFLQAHRFSYISETPGSLIRCRFCFVSERQIRKKKDIAQRFCFVWKLWECASYNCYFFIYKAMVGLWKIILTESLMLWRDCS